MKSASLFFLMMGLATLFCRAGYAAQSDSAKQQDTKSSGQQTRHHGASDKNSAHRGTTTAKPNRPQPLRNKRQQDGMTTSQALQSEASGAGNGPRAITRPVSAARGINPPNLSGPFGQSPPNSRHRGVNPATVGGTAKSVVRSTGVVSGNGVGHKR